MAGFFIKTIDYPASASAVALHDGTNGASNPPRYVQGFVIQSQGDAVYIGEGDVGEGAESLNVPANGRAEIWGPLSRGSHQSYDLTKVYCRGGAFTLVIEREEP